MYLSRTVPSLMSTTVLYITNFSNVLFRKFIYLFIYYYLENFVKKGGFYVIGRSFFVTEIRIASHSTEFVNKVLDKIRAGVPDGGIDDF